MAIIKKGMGSLDFLLMSPVYITKWSSFPCHMSRCQALVLSKIENIVPFPLPVHLKNSIGRISERAPLPSNPLLSLRIKKEHFRHINHQGHGFSRSLDRIGIHTAGDLRTIDVDKC